MSLVARAMVAANSAVKAPNMATTVMASVDASNTGKKRATKKTPGCDHGSRVDKSTDRRWALHGVREPDM